MCEVAEGSLVGLADATAAYGMLGWALCWDGVGLASVAFEPYCAGEVVDLVCGGEVDDGEEGEYDGVSYG